MFIGDYLARRETYSPARTAIVDAGKEPGAATDLRADE
jgi:hypothetical protein